MQHAGTVFPGLPDVSQRPEVRIGVPDPSQPLSEPAA